jgi:Arylsulfotransferase (ASST)/Repeat of unknown function (DUF346)
VATTTWRLLIAASMTASVLAAIVLAPRTNLAAASVPNDQVTVSVSGSLTSMSSNPAFFPAFTPSTTDYAIHCESGVNIVTLQFGGVTPAIAKVSLGENQAADIETSSGQTYWIRCLPHDFPVFKITGSASAVPGWYLTGNISGATNGSSSTYAMVLDSNGTPVWYQKAPGGANNVEAVSNDTIAWMPSNGPGVGENPSVGYNLYNLDTQTSQTLSAPLLPTDFHELYPMANGDYMMIGTPLTQLSVPFDNYHQIVDCVVQEVTPQGNLVWWWQASDHVALAESVHGTPATYNGQTALDAFHCNAVDVDPATGQVLISMRDASSLYLVERVNPSGALVQNGPIMWKLEGCGSSQVGTDHEPVLAVEGDPETCFDAQHDARFQANGRISLYDDHTYQHGGGARGVEYSVETATSTANWVEQFPPQPSGANGGFTGSFRTYLTGADNLVGWGITKGSGFTESDGSGKPFFSMTYPNGEFEYRVVKVPLSTFDVNTLRATAGLPRSSFPTVSFDSLGGELTSKPAVAAWSSNRLDTFIRGTDGQLWHKWWNGTTWSGWEPLGGQIYPGTGPAVATWAAGRLDVFVEGTDRRLYHKWFDSAGWHGWEALGGVLNSGPAAVSWGADRIDVVADGTDHSVWHKWWSGMAWSGWQSLGGQTTSDPSIASWASGRLDVFVKGTDNQLRHLWFSSHRWVGWESLGGNLTTGPAATSVGPGLVDVAAAGAGEEPERLSFSSGWSVWQPLGAATTETPAIVSFQGGEDVFVTGTGRALWYGAIR